MKTTAVKIIHKSGAAILKSLLTISFVLSLVMGSAGQARKATRFRMFEPNVYAPGLYADRLRAKFTLVDLPGSSDSGSFWEVSYSLYFVPEAASQEEIERRARGGAHPAGPPQYPRQILLSKGQFKKRNLATLKDRTHILGGVSFKSRIPDRERTKFATLMTVYSVKIYDARLKTTAYHSSYFETNPFADDPAEPQRAIPRTTVYTSFYLSPKGNIWGSQLPREGDSINW